MRVPRFSLAIFLVLLTVLVTPLAARAQGGCIAGDSSCSSAPELDPALAAEAIAVLAGAGLWIRFGTRKRER